MSSPSIDLVRRFGDVLTTGDLAALDGLLAHDCRDGNPAPFQAPGRPGVALKIAWYRALQPESRSRFLHVVGTDDLVVAHWLTELPDGSASRHRGRFTIANGRITAFEVDDVG